MSRGMADIVEAALAKHKTYRRNPDDGGMICDECGWEVANKYSYLEPTTSRDRANQHEASVITTALTQAGYGLLPNVTREYGAPLSGINGPVGPPVAHGPVRDPDFLTKSTHTRLVGPWEELTPDPMAAAFADPEGRALVQDIHDRKAGTNG